jgi:hypothetical protein
MWVDHDRPVSTRSRDVSSARPLACLAAALLSAMIPVSSAVAASSTPEVSSNSAKGSRSGAGNKVRLLTSSLPAMSPGQSGWVSLNWQAAKWDATSFQVTASETTGAVKISYPENTGSYSSLYRESFLLAGGVDYTSFYLQVSPDARDAVEILFRVSYEQRNGKGSGSNATKRVVEEIPLEVPLVEAGANAVAVATTSVTASASTPAWQKIDLSAVGPGVTSVRVTVTGPDGLVVGYPGDRTESGLNADANLDVGETDFAAVRLDAARLGPGRYGIVVVVEYGRSQSVRREIELGVTP